MENYRVIASALIVIAILASFFAGSMGFGLRPRVQELPTARYTLAPSCNLDQKLEEWKDGDMSIKELMDSVQAKKDNRGC